MDEPILVFETTFEETESLEAFADEVSKFVDDVIVGFTGRLDVGL